MIFLSYASEDSDRAAMIYSAIVRPDRPVFYDKQSLVPGMDWREQIENALENCVLTIVLCSKHSVGKEGFVQKEIRLAIERSETMPEGRVFIVPVRFDGVRVPKKLARYQWLSIESENDYRDLEFFVDILWDGLQGVALNHREHEAAGGYDRDLLKKDVVLFLQGRNMADEEIYAYVKLQLWKLRQLKRAMALEENFSASDFGEVLQSGIGKPSKEMVERFSREYNMVPLGPGSEEERKRIRQMREDFLLGFREAFAAQCGEGVEAPAVAVPINIPNGSNAFREGIRQGLEAARRHVLRSGR